MAEADIDDNIKRKRIRVSLKKYYCHKSRNTSFVVGAKWEGWIPQECFDLKQPNFTRTSTSTLFTASQDMTSPYLLPVCCIQNTAKKVTKQVNKPTWSRIIRPWFDARSLLYTKVLQNFKVECHMSTSPGFVFLLRPTPTDGWLCCESGWTVTTCCVAVAYCLC